MRVNETETISNLLPDTTQCKSNDNLKSETQGLYTFHDGLTSAGKAMVTDYTKAYTITYLL